MTDKLTVAFAMPTFSAAQCLEGRDSMIMTDRLLTRSGVNVIYLSLPHDPYLAKARSKLATIFLEDYPHADILFFIDDDISWPAQKALDLILRPEPVVAGVYPKKTEGLQFPCSLLGDVNTGKILEHDGMWAASMVPTGFLAIKRPVIEMIAKNSGKFWDSDNRDVSKRRLYAEIFKMGVWPGEQEWYGEDPWFCREWRDMGGEIWVDPDIEFTHRGSRKWCARLLGNLGEQIMPEKEAAE